MFRLSIVSASGLCAAAVAAAQAAPSAPQPFIEELRQQERERALREQQERALDVRLPTAPERAAGRLPESEIPCFRIDRLLLEGERADDFQWLLSEAAGEQNDDSPLGRCLGTQGVNIVLERLQQALIARGWVTSRVLAAPQDLASGTLRLTLVPGRIAATLRAMNDASLAVRGSLTNDGKGTLTAGRHLAISAQQLTSGASSVLGAGVQSDGTLGPTGDLTVTTAQSLAAHGSNLAGGNALLHGSAIDLDGSQTRVTDLTLSATQGNITTRGATVAASGSTVIEIAGDLDNSGGKLTAIGGLDARAGGVIKNLGGTIAANGDVGLQAGSLDNAQGTVRAVEGTLQVATAGTTSNTGGTLQAGTSVALNNAGLVNAAGQVIGDSLSIDTRGQTLGNRGGTLAATTTVSIASGVFDNTAGLVQSGGAMVIDTHGQTLTNTQAANYETAQGGITSAGALDLSTGAVDNTGGFIGSKGDLRASTTGLVNGSGGIVLGQSALAIDTQGGLYDNRGGQTQSIGALRIDAGTIDNSGSLIRSLDTATLNAATVTNTNTQGTEQGIEGRNVAIATGTLNNASGAIRADADTTTGIGAKRTDTDQRQETSLVRSTLNGANVNISATGANGEGGTLLLAGTAVNTLGTLTLEADKLVMGTQTTQIDQSTTSQGRDLMWQKAKGEGTSDQTTNSVQFNAGQLATNVNSVQAGLGARDSIDALSHQPGMGWVSQINSDPKPAGKVDWVKVEEAHTQWDYKQQGLTPEGAAIVTLVAAYFAFPAAQGAGASAGAAVGGGMTGTVVTGAVTAGVTTLASQAAVAVINNRGNLGDALHDLGSSENIKGLVTAIITGGVLQGLNMNPTGQPTVGGGAQGFMNQLGQNLQAGAARAVIGTAINGGSFEDNLKNSLKSAILDTAAAQTAFAIGDLKEVGALDRFTQGFAHAVAGCAIGALTADSGSACGAGALGAAVGGIAAQAYGSKADTVQFAAFLGGLAAAAAGGDAALIDLAGQAAANAVANNHQAHPGWGYEYPEVDHPFAPTDEFKARFFGSEAERAVWFRTQEIAAGTAQTREWLQFDDPKVQLPRSGGPLYQIFDLGGNSAGAVRIAYSPRNPSVFYVSLDHYGATSAQPLRWTRFEATSK